MSIARALKRPLISSFAVIRRRLTPQYVVSFPKSGRTWLRVFIAKYIAVAYGVPFSVNTAPLIGTKTPLVRLGFSHCGFDAVAGVTGERKVRKCIDELAGKRIVLLVRDPRDVVVSYFFQRRARDVKYGRGIDERVTLSHFIRDDVNGLHRIIDLMNRWYDAWGGRKDFLLLRYEDCRAQTEHEFRRVLSFLIPEPIREDALKAALAYSSFENMKEMERSDALKSDVLRPADAQNPDSFKVRKGQVGGWRELFNHDDTAYAAIELKRLHRVFGYST